MPGVGRLAGGPAVRLAIGALALVAQPVAAQGGDGVGWIGARSAVFRDRFTQLLLAVPTRDLPTGWRLALDLGRPVAPLLWEMLRAEKSNIERRLVLLAAAMLAGGTGEDDRVFEWLRQPKSMLEERVLAAMLLALGPRRTRAVPDFWSACFGPDKTQEQLLTVAVRLAAARFPGTGDGVATIVDDDPGLAAAAAFAGLPLSTQVTARLWRQRDRYAALFWRGALLGDAWRLAALGAAPTLLDRAADVLGRLEDEFADARAAAILLRARAGLLDPAARRPDWRLLQVAVSAPGNVAALRRWLQPTPLAQDQQPGRLAVAYALVQPVGEIVDARAAWGADARIRRPIALALALRLTTEQGPPIAVDLPEVPEWSFVRWASGGPFDAATRCEDPRLDALAALVADGRARVPVVRDALEEALWRFGCHPGIAAWEQERRLLRDLLLVGSKHGGGQYQPSLRPDERYFPTGLDRNDEAFRILVTLFDLLFEPRCPIPPELRLR